MRVADTITSDVEYSGPRSRKPGRGKSAATIELGQAAATAIRRSGRALTLRQLYYVLVSEQVIPKDEASYGRLKRVMRDLREEGVIPWDWLVDHTRQVFQPRTWDGLEGLLADSAAMYRRDLMRNQNVAIQLWAESDSVGSVIADVADRYTVPTFIGRGYSARGYLWAAAEDAVEAHEAGKTVHILHVGDYDPSGEDIYRDVEQTLSIYAEAIEYRTSANEVRRWLEANLGDDWPSVYGGTDWLRFERLALTSEQIEEHNLPSRPPKASDVRTAKFSGTGAVEVEALPVDVLLGIVEDAIQARIDPGALATIELAERSEQEIARRIAGTPVEKLIEAAA